MSSNRMETPVPLKLNHIPKTELLSPSPKEDAKTSKEIPRQLNNLLLARKLRQQQMSKASGIVRSSSFKEISTFTNGIKKPDTVKYQMEVTKKPALVYNENLNDAAAKSNIPVPRGLTRAATFRTPAYSSVPHQVQHLRPIQSKICSALPSGVPSSTMKLEYLEERFHQKVINFPSYIQQQVKGPNFTPGWDWIQQFHKYTLELKQCTDSTELENYKNRLAQFLNQARMVDTILEQVSIIFHQGIPTSETSLCSSYQKPEVEVLCPVGKRGRNTLNDGTMHYVAEIFEHEMSKEKIYNTKFRTKSCTPYSYEFTRRNELVRWMYKTAGDVLKYPAETAHLAVYIIDAYLTKVSKIDSKQWGLIGITALQIAGKLEEPEPVSALRLIRQTGQFYRMQDLIRMEQNILEKLQFDVYPPLAPLFVQLVIVGGSLSFPSVNIKNLVMDLAQGILYRSLEKHLLTAVPASDKAKAAIEIAVEFIFINYRLFSKLEVQKYDYISPKPGSLHGAFAVQLCLELFEQRLAKTNIKATLSVPAVPHRVQYNATPSMDVKGLECLEVVLMIANLAGWASHVGKPFYFR